ncbi:MAG: dihydroneopterin aldolase [Acidimicrobiia bacterium]|nr:dihydroneopterin aldolase [Acidimicrobiia bacterium]MDH3397999.1 dihydroneopterin aldolase [Acidimicrobiia bacterium]
MDTISLFGLRVYAYHGVLAEEKSAGQEFIVDVTLHADLAIAASSDDLADTVDYGALAAAIHDRVANEQWNLIERVAGRVADLVMEDERVFGIEVRVHKPAAPIAVPFDDVVVEVRRRR